MTRRGTNACYLLNIVEFIIFMVIPESTSALKQIFLTLESLNNDNIVLWELQEGTTTGYKKSCRKRSVLMLLVAWVVYVQIIFFA